MSDRPLSRRLVRLGALALGPGRAHRQDLWPHMAIEGAEVRWKGRPLMRLKPLAALVPPGMERVAIVGSGPSLGRQEPARIGPGSAILLNGAARLAAEIPPLAVAVEDERFLFRRGEMIADLPFEVPLLLSPAALRALAEREGDRVARRPVGLIWDIRRPVGGRKRALSDPAFDSWLVRGGGGAALSLAPEAGIVVTGTVAYSALQVALASRPKEVLLAGIDLSNDAEPRFYERPGDTAPSGLSRGLDRILAGFALARSVAGRQGVHLACASPVSALLGLGYDYDARLEPNENGPAEGGPA